jgi:fatty acid desaturase
MLLVGAAAAVGVTAFVLLGQSWWQLALAVYWAVVFTHVGFLGHDAGHQQIFRHRRWNDLLGLVLSNLGIGLSYGWWVDKHTRHHRHPNDLVHDPDVQRNVLAWTEEQATSQRGLRRFIARHQAACFFPLLLLEAWSLHVTSVRTLIARPRERVAEIALLLAHVAGCLTLLLVILPPVKAVAFIAVQQCLFGVYLGCSFAPNHKGMPVLDGTVELGFLRRQVLTSRNVSGGRVLTAALGGLNYQIEHHLFPSMPSRNLRRCKPLVEKHCVALGLPYCEMSLFGSLGRVLRYLRSVRPGSQRPAPSSA